MTAMRPSPPLSIKVQVPKSGCSHLIRHEAAKLLSEAGHGSDLRSSSAILDTIPGCTVIDATVGGT
jgi:hypothetical protein